MKLTNSKALAKTAEGLIPLGAQTFSKSKHWFPEGAYPIYLDHGKDGHVWDVDGQEYVDLICGLGAITLGYNNLPVTRAMQGFLEDYGWPTFSLPHPIEVELAQKLHDIIPCAECVRFAKNGTDVTNAAVRLARAITGRECIAQFGYHGGGNDWYGAISERPAGIPIVLQGHTFTFNYNDIESLEKIFDDLKGEVACVIMEPVIFTPPQPGFLEQVAELTRKNGAMLVWDEMVTGFRWHLGGAQSYFGITPDLACFGKGLGNGMPISALVGKAEYMKRLEDLPIFFSYTFAGECLSMVAALATIEQMENGALDKLWQNGHRLWSGLSAVGFKLIGYPCRFHITLEDETPATRSLFMAELARNGLLMHSVGVNICAAHTNEDMNKVISVCSQALEIVNRGIREGNVVEKIGGQIISPAFRRF